MKHTLKVTLILIFLFFMSQVIGLLITNAYIDHEATLESGEVTFVELPYEIERPPVEEKSSFVFILVAVLIGTLLVLLLIKFKRTFLWKVWFFFSCCCYIINCVFCFYECIYCFIFKFSLSRI
jgi:hypothetical protein